MKILMIVLAASLAMAQQNRPEWAFPVADKVQPNVAENNEPRKMPGSTKSYTPAQIDDLANPPDWYPDEHGAVPQIVQKGNGAVLACGACHLMSGHGHPESADIAGLPVNYLIHQMEDFKSGARKDSARMNAIAKDMTAEDIKASSTWAAGLKPGGWVRVIESEMVPKSYVSVKGRMRLPLPEGGMEPLGKRIVELPEDMMRATSRDPKSPFIAYVPMGSIAKGAALAAAGKCGTCHGEGLKGRNDFPRLANLHPIYIVRQLYNLQTGVSAGPSAAMMKNAVAGMSEDDMIALAAYAASLQP